jgi:ribosomal-protein-alanine N-acetyltransferase
MNAVFIEGQKIRLCVLDPQADLHAYERWVNDTETTEHMSIGRYPITKTKLIEYIKRYNSSQDFLLGIFLKEDDRHIGNITLHYIDTQNRSAEIGILIGEKDCRGHGYGREAVAVLAAHAFNRLGLHKLTTGMVEGNIASQRMFEKAGFVQEGRLRESFYINGRYCDCLRYGLIASEWKG